MAKSDFLTTISIDSERSVFHFCSIVGNDKKTIEHSVKHYAGNRFDGDFFDKFKKAVTDYAQSTPSDAVRKVTVVLPDSAVMTDVLRIPTMKTKLQTKKALDTLLSGLYRNYSELRVNSQVAEQNKQYTTFRVAAVKREIVSSIYAACSENKMLVDTLTYSSGAQVGGACLCNPKLKNASYVLLDIKDVFSRFIFVVKGNAVGSYTLPFGFEFLRKNRVTQEDMLFDHSYAEVTVLNARERAKSKKLTVMSTVDMYAEATKTLAREKAITANTENEDASEDDLDTVFEDSTDELEEDAAADATEEAAGGESRPQPQQKLYVRKTPRKLPKFMLRDIPETEEGVLYENFRVFVKWALTLIDANAQITELGEPEFVCVNMPSDLAGVLDKVNEEKEENGIEFKLLAEEEESYELSNLELYGGLFPVQIPKTSKF